MLSANRTQIGEQISAVTQQLIFLALATAADIDKEDRRLPDDNVDPLVIELFAYLVMWYKEDTEGLLKKYREGGLWKAAIRKQLGMDDPDEKGYWYYHVYREKPNVLFSIYFEEHPAIALEKLLEMFEHGWQKEYLELNLDLKSLVDETMLTFAVREIFTIIDGRIFDNRLVHPKETARFLIYLYSLSPKVIESHIQTYENSTDPDEKEFAETYRHLAQHENAQQTALALA